jgi:ribosomal protection tetracycline resistance protein
MGQYVRRALQEGLYGWQVTDCIVAMTQSDYSLADGPPSRRGPLPTAADYRKLTPLVVMRALERAGTVVCEPSVRVSLEIPAETIGAVIPALGRLGAAVEAPSLLGDLATIETVLPVARAQELQRQLARLTGGEGVLESSFAGYKPLSGEQLTRRRTMPNPLNFNEYMMHLARRVGR